jgi:hypothetical protein
MNEHISGKAACQHQFHIALLSFLKIEKAFSKFTNFSWGG